jgi:histidyl-tRNA synthetase
VIIGEDEIAQGKVKIKENGLREGHPEKEGVLVNISDLVSEIKQRLKRKADLDSVTREAEGLKVVGGIRGELENVQPAAETGTPAEPVNEAPPLDKANEEAPAS